MPTWGRILGELRSPENTLPNGQPNTDRVRRKYIAQLSALTQRPVIVYATAFLDKPAPADVLQIQLGDLQGFMEAVAGIQQRELDLLVTSPGGLAEAAESIASYLRTKFDHVRAFVPLAAMSAATMLVLCADELVLGRHSQLGPIDPQFSILTPEGPRSAPARAILDQFERAKEECQVPANLPAWMPILRGYGPGLLAQCVDQEELAMRIVAEWLHKYMLRDDSDGLAKAEAVARWFADYEYFGSHSRRVSIQDLRSLGLRVTPLEDDQNLQDAVLSVHHAVSHTFTLTPTVKLVENHLGRTWAKLVGEIVIEQRPAASPASPQPSRPPNRAERRRQERGQRRR